MARRRRDYYDVLGVPRDAEETDIKRAYRELARTYHPDLNPQGADRFKEINEAYAVLSDKDRRARYDRWGPEGGDAAAGGGIGSVMDAVEEVLGDVLRRRKGKQRGRDLRYTLEVDFRDAAFGTTKTINIPDGPADAQGGAATAKTREFQVVVPAGTREGSVKMIKGEGEPGKNGGQPGDLHVIVRVKEHPLWKREGFDVWCEVPITFPQAALGAVIDVPTLDGNVRMRIPEGSQSGRVFRIRGRGVPRAAGKNAPHGDHLVKVFVEVPSQLTARQRELIEELATVAGEERAHPQKKTFLDRVRSLLQE
jgi:molecular chaperone DnaJ